MPFKNKDKQREANKAAAKRHRQQSNDVILLWPKRVLTSQVQAIFNSFRDR